MNAELLLRFRKFPEEIQSNITRALHGQATKNNAEYKDACSALPKIGLEWLIDYQTGLLNRV